MTIVFLIILSCISACLYRMGGCGPADLQSEWGWVPTFIRDFPKKRDVGCGVCMLIASAIVGITAPWWIWVICFGLSWGALSTYWDWINGEDNFYLHGLGIGMAFAPFMFFGEPVALGIRIGILSLVIGIWSEAVGNATKEELGRGFVLPLTLGLAVFL